MVSRLWRLVLIPLFLATLAWADRGIVVVSVKKYSEAADAGVEPGDLLLSWSRGADGGAIQTPFDLMLVEINRAPLGAVVIAGTRNSEKASWKLGAGDWGIETRPNFSQSDLTLYSRAKNLIASGDAQEAYSIWQSIASRETGNSWIYSWCAEDAAALIAQRRRWKYSDMLYREAVARSKQDRLAKLFVLRAWTITFELRQDWDMVITLSRLALSESESLDGEGLLTASVLNDDALIADWRRDLKTARELYERALVIEKKIAPTGLITVHTLLGLALLSINGGQQNAAQEFLDQAGPLIDAFPPGSPESARFRSEQASLMLRRGDLNQAKQLLTEAREILQTHLSDSLDYSKVLSSLAFVSARQGDLSNSELELKEALAIYDKNPLNPVLGLHLSNDLAVIAFERRDFPSATKYGMRTEKIAAKLMPDSIDHAGVLMNLGMYTFQNNDLKASESYWIRASEIIRKAVPGSVEQAKILGGVARVARQLGDYNRSERYALEEKRILEQSAPDGVDMADAFENLAETYRYLGNLQQAEDYARREIGIRERFVRSGPDYADSLALLAEILQAEGQLDLARKEYEHFATSLDQDMTRLGGDEGTRIGFRALHEATFKRYIDLLIQQGKIDESFALAERSRACALLEMLTQSAVDFDRRLDPEVRTKRDSLRKEFAAESDHRLRLLTAPHSAEQLKVSDAQISKLLNRFEELQSQIRDTSPGYSELTKPTIATVKDVQDRLLDSNTLLLEYSLGQERSHLWLISSESVSVYNLPKRAEIEKEAKRAYHEITAQGTSTLDSRFPRTVAESQIASPLALEELSRMILGPVERILGHKRLLIVPDGALNYIPFGALPLTNGPGVGTVLLTSHEIIYLPSASLSMALRREYAGRPSPPETVAVLADPVFNLTDPRVKRNGAVQQASSASSTNADGKSFATLRSVELTRMRWGTALGHNSNSKISLPRLAYSRREAQAIMAVSPSAESLEALDFKASRAEAMSPDLARYKIVHFATHGLIDTTRPELSSLIFSLYNEQGSPEIGLLSLEDIYNLNLPVDMVVLSACETALGKDATGEGLIGLTRGFMYAGASRVVASLWDVNDVATAHLMASFYGAMEQEHLSAAAALRKAQLEMQKNKHWENPYYWAGFELQGEWK